MTAPCKDCPDRHNLCWPECEKYQSFRRQKDKENALRRSENDRYGISQRGVSLQKERSRTRYRQHNHRK